MLNAMRGVTLNIKLNNDIDTYTSGDRIEGIITVIVNEAIYCQKLVVSNQFRVDGEGKFEVKEIFSIVVFNGEWQVGQYQYPFAISVPNQGAKNIPATYHGHYINVYWLIAVTADIKLKETLEVIVPYKLIKPIHQLEELDVYINNSSKIENIIFYLIIIASIIAGIVLLIVQYDFLQSDSLIAIFSITLFIWLLSPSSRKKFGNVQLLLNKSEIKDNIKANLMITTKKDITVDKFTAYLEFEEYTTTGSLDGDTFNRDKRTLSTFKISNGSRVSLTKGRTKSFTIIFDITEPLVPSLNLDCNDIIYRIKFVAVVDNKEHEWSQQIIIS